jgi:hypothetical protein
MKVQTALLLTIDGLLNVVLGLVLLVFPTRLPEFLGLPASGTGFYPSILGAVLLGIAVALFLEIRSGSGGLGPRGAIAINLVGGGVLMGWLLSGLQLPLRGAIVLWIVATLVLGLSLLEWRATS